MKQLFITLITLITISSCNSTKYYAYTENGTYCVFEVRKDQVIYRAVSKHYKNLFPNENYSGIPIHVRSLMKKQKGEAISFDPARLYTMNLLYSHPMDDNLDLSAHGYSPIYYFKHSKNELLLSDWIKINFTFGGNNDVIINWLPPELKRIKEKDIDKDRLITADMEYDYFK